eukprot:598739-Pyramimonas_sp.AAC.1
MGSNMTFLTSRLIGWSCELDKTTKMEQISNSVASSLLWKEFRQAFSQLRTLGIGSSKKRPASQSAHILLKDGTPALTPSAGRDRWLGHFAEQELCFRAPANSLL